MTVIGTAHRSRRPARSKIEPRDVPKGVDEALCLGSRLQMLLQSMEEKVAAEAPRWLCESELGEVVARVPPRYFEPFADEVTQLVCIIVQDRATGNLDAQVKLDDMRRRLAENTQAYLREVNVYRDKLAPWKRAIELESSEEEIYIYEPLKFFDENMQAVMREVIDERVRQVLSKGLRRKFRGDVDPEELTDEERLQLAQDEIIRLKEEVIRKDVIIDRMKGQMGNAEDARNELMHDRELLDQEMERLRQGEQDANASRDEVLAKISNLEGCLKKEQRLREESEEKTRELSEAAAQKIAESGGDEALDVKRGPSSAELEDLKRQLARVQEEKESLHRQNRQLEKLQEANDSSDGHLETMQKVQLENDRLKKRVAELEKRVADRKDQLEAALVGKRSNSDSAQSLDERDPSGSTEVTPRQKKASTFQLESIPRQTASFTSEVFKRLHGDAGDRVVRKEDVRGTFATNRQTSLLSQTLTKLTKVDEPEAEDETFMGGATIDLRGFRGVTAADSLATTASCSQLWAAAMQLKRVGSEGRLQVRLRRELPNVLGENDQRLVYVNASKGADMMGSGKLHAHSMSELSSSKLGKLSDDLETASIPGDRPLPPQPSARIPANPAPTSLSTDLPENFSSDPFPSAALGRRRPQTGGQRRVFGTLAPEAPCKPVTTGWEKLAARTQQSISYCDRDDQLRGSRPPSAPPAVASTRRRYDGMAGSVLSLPTKAIAGAPVVSKLSSR